MSFPKKLLAGGIAAIALAVAALFIFLFFIRDDSPEEFELRTEEEVAEDRAAAPDATDAPDAPDAAESEEAEDTAEGIEGNWTIGPGSQAGYRVIEDFAAIPDFEAVGRTSELEGFLTIEGTVVTTATFDVDIASMTSDSGRRDGQFKGAIMNASEFPTAKFVLTSPIDLGEVPGEATANSFAATGDLTLRGVTNSVDVAIDAQLLSGEIEVVGSIDVIFADFGINNPSNGVVTVRDEGKVEFQLIFIR
ncbi:MAG: YceI family protein [Acidimicrobiales bacterium]